MNKKGFPIQVRDRRLGLSRRILCSPWISLALVGMLAFGPVVPLSPGSTPAALIQNLQTNLAEYAGGQVPLYEKFEVTFELDIGERNPFDPGKVRVDGCFFEPGQSYNPDCAGALVQPAFYYQDYFEPALNAEEIFAAREEYLPVPGSQRWKVRFTPTYQNLAANKIATYKYCLRVAFDGDQNSQCDEAKSFKIINTPTRPGFIRVDEANPRYFSFSSGAPFIGIGMNLAYWEDDRRALSTYRFFLNRMSEYGLNLARVWMTNSVREATREEQPAAGGQLTAEKILSLQDQQLGANYNLAEAWIFDRILEQAEEGGIYFILTLEDAGQLTGEWQEEFNLYQAILQKPLDFLSDPQAINYQEQVLRYVLARWGYSPNIMTWELFNEIDDVVKDIVKRSNGTLNLCEQWKLMQGWHEHMADFLDRGAAWDSNTAAHPHLVNTSTGSYLAYPVNLDQSTECPDPARLTNPYQEFAGIDFAQMHFYSQLSRDGLPEAETEDFLLSTGKDMTGLVYYYGRKVYSTVDSKPSLIGEFGLAGQTAPQLLRDKDDQAVHLHNGLWSSLMSGMATSALHYYWGTHRINDHAWWRHYRALANFFADFRTELGLEDLVVMQPANVVSSIAEPPGPSFEILPAEGTSSAGPQLRAMGLRLNGGDSAYFWIQNMTSTWWNYLHYTEHGTTGRYVYASPPGSKIIPQSGVVLALGFTPNQVYRVEWWDTYQTDPDYQILSQETVQADEQGRIRLVVTDLEHDVAVKIRPGQAAISVRLDASDASETENSDVPVTAVVRNSGKAVLHEVLLTLDTCAKEIPSLAPGAEKSLTCQVYLQADQMVKAEATGLAPDGSRVRHRARDFLSARNQVVGCGVPESCTETDFAAAMEVAAGGQTVTFNCGEAGHKYSIPLHSPIEVDGNPTVDGGMSAAGTGGVSLSGSNLGRLFTVRSSGTLTLRNLSLQSGAAHRSDLQQDMQGGGAVWVQSYGQLVASHVTYYANSADTGGAVWVSAGGAATFDQQSSFVRNISLDLLGYGGDGGAIYDNGTLTLVDSFFNGNVAYGGGALTIMRTDPAGSPASATIERSLFLSNTASDQGPAMEAGNGGAIEVAGRGHLEISNSTFYNNRAEMKGGALAVLDMATAVLRFTTLAENGGIYQTINDQRTERAIYGRILFNESQAAQSLEMKANILGNLIPGSHTASCSGSMTSLGYNLSDDWSCGLTQASDRQSVNPRLDPLDGNGGPTQTLALLPGSPALDWVPESGCALEIDQRGATRPQNIKCDVGAYEMIRVSVRDATGSEGDAGESQMAFTLEYQGNPIKGLQLQIPYETQDGTALAGSDYTAASGFAEIQSGSTHCSIPVSVSADLLDEQDEKYSLHIHGERNALVDRGTATGTIRDDDQAALHITDASQLEGNEGSTYLIFKVSSTNPSVAQISVDYQTVDGTAVKGQDYRQVAGTLTFAPGETEKKIKVEVLPDRLSEGSEQFQLKLSNPVNAVLDNKAGTGTILDDDGLNVFLPIVCKQK